MKLIDKVLRGKATESEKANLTRWIAADPANKADYDDLKLMYENAAKTIENIGDDDPFYDGLRRIESAIEILKKKGKKIKRHKTIRIVLGIVAFFMAVMAGSWLRSHYTETQLSTRREGKDTVMVLSAPLRFDDATLEEIIKTLEEKYGLAFNVSTKELLTCRFTGSFSRGSSIPDIVRFLAESMGFDYKILSRHLYVLHGEGCARGD